MRWTRVTSRTKTSNADGEVAWFWRAEGRRGAQLYVPDIQIYPAQINGDYSFLSGGDPDRIVRFGRWNQELAERWANEADIILIEEHFYEGWLKLLVKTGDFIELESTPPTVSCRADSQIRIFQRR